MDRVVVAVALGSNVGNRRAHLDAAVERLRESIETLHISSYHETDPVGVAPQRRFLNAAAAGTTALDARNLLDRLRAIERAQGRERPFAGAPRTLDLDLILFGSLVIDEPDLVVPHPRFRERRFVLEPLAEVGPDLRDPVTGFTVAALLGRLDVRG